MPFKILGILLLLIGISFAAEESGKSVFEPRHPAKPLRYCSAYAKWEAYVKSDTSYVDISRFPHMTLDMRYGTFQNVTGHDLYCGAKRAYLKTMAAQKLRKAIRLLQQEKPGYRFIVYDAARPVYAQSLLRQTVAGTPFSDFVSNPKRGSVHNFGYALDLTIADEKGNALDMGTDFDSFESRAGEQGEADALKNGFLQEFQIENRRLLKRIMKKAGVLPLSSEWWHFNAIPSKTIRATGELPPF